MYNYVQRVFVGTTGAVSSTQTVGNQLNLATVVVGDLFLVDENGVILDAAAAAATKTARVVRGTAVGKTITSSLLKSNPGNGTKYTFQAYTAPVAQVTTFADLGLVANTDYKLEIVIQQDLPLISNRQDRIDVFHTTPVTGFVAATELAKIITKINRQRAGITSVLVASTSGGTNLTLTGKPVLGSAIDDYSFVRFDSAFVTYSVVNAVTGIKNILNLPTAIQPTSVTAAVGGSGVAVQVRAMERVALGNFGFTDPRGVWYKGPLPFGAVDGTGYDLYNIQQLLSGEYQFQDVKSYPHSTVVAVATGGAQRAAFGAILDAFMQGVAPATVTGE